MNITDTLTDRHHLITLAMRWYRFSEEEASDFVDSFGSQMEEPECASVDPWLGVDRLSLPNSAPRAIL